MNRLARHGPEYELAPVFKMEALKTIDLITTAFSFRTPFPLKSSKRDRGLRDVEVHFGGVRFRPGAWLYADADGVLVCTEPGRPLEA